jgi:hypothetical protein
VEETARRLCPAAFWRRWNYWSMMADVPGGLRRRRMELGGQIQRWRWCARSGADRRRCSGWAGWQWQRREGNLGGPAASVAPPSPFPLLAPVVVVMW